jgi:hypothetical protein
MKQRTKDFAKEIIELCRKLPNNREGRLIGDQTPNDKQIKFPILSVY